MRKLLFLSLLFTATSAFSVCLNPPSPQPVSGFGCDVPTAATCTASGTDASKATCTWTTTLSSDSEVEIIDASNNPLTRYYNGAMTTSHTVNLTRLPPSPSKIKWMVSSCTHATYLPAGRCPDTSPDWSSTGPPTRMPGVPPQFATIVPPVAPLSSWWTITQAPTNVFPGQEFYIQQKAGPGIGVFGTTNSNVNNIRFLLVHDVTIDAPGPVTNQCGTNNTAVTPNYFSYGDGTFNAPCLGGSPDTDFILEPVPSSIWIQANVNGNATPGVVSGTTPTMQQAGQAGYFINGWTGTDLSVYVKVGANVAPGNYVIHYHLQPLLWNGCGNGSGGTLPCADSSLLGQDKQVDVPITVIALAPLASHPPVTFPTWTFQKQFMAMASYWSTWECSNISDIRAGTGPMGLMYNSGVYSNIYFTNSTSSSWPWVYDGASMFLGTGDLIYANTYPAWTALHNYTIGDRITMTVGGKPTTFVMNLVNGASSPGLIGTSGSSTPSFTRTPGGSVTADGLLQWMSVVDKDYYNGCALKVYDGFRNNFLMTMSTNAPEYTNQPGGMIMSYFRTQDSSPGDYTGFSYTAATGNKFSNLTKILNAYVEPKACNLLSETSGSGYWQGGTNLALCYMSSPVAQLGTSINANNIGTGRQKGFLLNVQTAYWSLTNDPTWINGNNPGDDGGARTKRQVETLLAYLDMYTHLPAENYTAVNSVNFQLAAYFMSGIVAEALINYYIETVYYSNTTNFPCTMPTGYTTGYMGPCVTPDERIPQAIKAYADYTWVNEYDIEYDKNQSVADSCYPLHTPQCQNTRRLHSYTTRYNRWTFPDYSYSATFNTESDSNGEYGFVWAWLWARDSTMVPPSNGRITVTTYRDIALNMWEHSYDGRNCPNVSGSTPGNCTAWGIQDFVNGGRSTGSGYNQLVNNSKTVNQTIYNTMRSGLHWALGDWTSSQSPFQLSTNPCWIVANRNVDGSCNAPSPFTDVMAPYTMAFYFNGGRPGVITPTICYPGLVGNNLNGFCIQANPTQTPTAAGLGSNNVPLNGGRLSISNTFATITFLTIKNATCQLVADTPVIEPTHTVANTFPESPAHTPSLAGGTPLPLWFHTITASGLTPTTTYHYGIYCTDDASTPADPATCTANADHCFNYPYQIAGTTGKFAVQNGNLDQARTFQTTALPTGADLSINPGVIVQPGVKAQ